MRLIKLLLAIALVLCLFHNMPYGYYTLVRFVAMACFAYMSFSYFSKKSIALAFTFGALALLFQPFVKIALGRDMWEVVDVAVAVLLLILCYKNK